MTEKEIKGSLQDRISRLQLGKGALEQIRDIRTLDLPQRGFILGEHLGGVLLIDRMISFSFPDRELECVYRHFLQTYQEHLLGMFFYRRKPLYRRCLDEDYLISIEPKRIFYQRNSGNQKGEALHWLEWLEKEEFP